MSALQTYLRRKTYGDKSWTAKTAEELEIDGRKAQLLVSTYKNDYGTLVTQASVSFITAPGILTFAVFSDFSARLAAVKTRCTEKAVSEQQARFVANWASLKQTVIDFYAEKAAA